MNANARRSGIARLQRLQSVADNLSARTHFSTDECKSLLRVHDCIVQYGKLDRVRLRDFLHSCLGISQDLMLDLMYKAFDRNNDGQIDEQEFVIGLSQLLRGNGQELTEMCYFIYDMNGDRSLAREELYQCLKGCIIPGYGVDADEIEDAERDIVEIVMRKLDVNKDGQITPDDFEIAVQKDPLLIQSCGPCIPSPKAISGFLATITDNYYAYTGGYLGTRIGTRNSRNNLVSRKSIKSRKSVARAPWRP